MKSSRYVKQKTWKEFRATGLLWFINHILHLFGWAIVIEMESGEVIDVYPARVKYRGFDEESNTRNYITISKYMKENADILYSEAIGEGNEDNEEE